MAGKRVKSLQSDLECLEVFECPKVTWEQYHTPPRIAAEMLHAIDMDTGLSGKTVLDLGCGCGILGLGCVNCGAEKVLGVDIDDAALVVAERNRDGVGVSSEKMRFLQCDVLKMKSGEFERVDICVSNPPFGTRTKNLDFNFVQKGLNFSDVMYSIHKSSTRTFFERKSKEMGINMDILCQDVKFPISKTYSFHKLKEQFILVDIIKFARKSFNG